MQRGSDHLSPHKDDEMKHELLEQMRSGRPTRVAEWHDPEPDAEDDPAVTGGRFPEATPEHIALRFELARRLGRRTLPGNRDAVLHDLEDSRAPDTLTGLVRNLPKDRTYRNVEELVKALRAAG